RNDRSAARKTRFEHSGKGKTHRGNYCVNPRLAERRRGMIDKRSLTPLGEVMIERQEMPSLKDIASGRIRVIEKISFDTGRIQLRSNGSTRTGMILVRPGDLVVSGINAAKGAIAI